MPDRRDDTDTRRHAPDSLNSATHPQETPVHELMPLPAILSADRERDGTGRNAHSHGSADSQGPARMSYLSSELSGGLSGGRLDAEVPIVTRRPKRARRGDIIGKRYVVDGQIAKGGMGRVLRVRHQVLGKYFALKVIRPPIAADKRVCEMFYREARLASALEHENICSIVDFGNDPDVGLFMVMELLEGMSLHDKLEKDGRMAAKVACAVMWDIGKAVKHMHSRTIVHGDIKSSNILLVRTAHKHRLVKLTDFGLARVAIDRRAGHVQGTPEYMAPELIGGQAASPLSDIYALGILFHELLIGRQPFVGDTESVLRQQLDDPLPRVSVLLDGGIDSRADEIIARATAKNPADRQRDMDAMLFELRALMNMLGIGGTYQRPRSVAEPPRASRQRTRTSARKLEGGAEVFQHSPVPLAAVNAKGRIRVANDAFMAFLGSQGNPADTELESSLLPAYYPQLLTDLQFVASRRTEVKRVLWLRNKLDEVVEVAVILQPGPSQAVVTAGDVHITLHPLGQTSASAETRTADATRNPDEHSAVENEPGA